MDRTVWWDTEDDSARLEKARAPGLNKRCTQIAAIDDLGERFYLRPKVTRTTAHGGGIHRRRWDVGPFLEWLAARGPRCTAWAHNTQYDLGNIFPDDLDKLDVTMVGGRLVSARWENCRFLDTANIFPMPLKKLGKAVGIEKGDLDEESEAYVWRDVEITRAAVLLAESMCNEHGAEMASTLGGLAVKFWQALGGFNWPCSLGAAREAYFGGRVEVFAPQMEGNLYYTDINSLYPSVMTGLFPSGEDLWFGLENRDRAESVLLDPGTGCWGIAHVCLDIPVMDVAPLPVRHDSGAVYYPVGKVEGWWTVQEIRRALAKGARFLWMDCAHGSMEAEAYYADFTRTFYALRKTESDPGRNLMLKLLMNNLYGQLGMSGEVTRSLSLAKHAVRTKDGGWACTREGVPYGKKLLAEVQMPLAGHVNWLHAAYVTSMARLALQEYLDAIPARDLAYCDTDSVIFRADAIPFQIGEELGQMKLEHRLTHVACRSPKMYRTRSDKGKIETKVKGVPRRDGLADKMFDNGRVMFRQPWKMRESIVGFNSHDVDVTRRTRVLSAWHDVEKMIVSGYDKKDLQNGRFVPKVHSRSTTA